MYSSEQARYDWCIKYCEENNLDLTYYRDWEVAEEAFEKSIKDFHEEIYKLYKETIKRYPTLEEFIIKTYNPTVS